MGIDEGDGVAVGAAPHARRGVIEPGNRVQRTDGSHPSMEGDQRGHQDLSSESSHPEHDL